MASTTPADADQWNTCNNQEGSGVRHTDLVDDLAIPNQDAHWLEQHPREHVGVIGALDSLQAEASG